MVKISKLTILLLILLAIFVMNRSVEAETSIYVFNPDQSTVVKTGGFAGVHITYAVTGQFQLTVNWDASLASFEKVDANLTDDTGSEYGRSLDEIFNMTGLVGTIIDDMTIEFEGKTADGTESDVSLKLAIREDSAHLAGKTTPPPNSADMFFYDIDAVATKKYAGGTGELNNPYFIYTAEQMNAIGADPNDWDKHFVLMADIDLSRFTGDAFNIIGYWFDSFDNKPFRGVFDGSGKKISNFSYTSNRNAIGLFGYVDDPNAVIRDLRLIDPNIDAPLASPVGSLLGHLSSGTITNCHVVDGRVLGDYSTGGLVGFNSGTITNCYSSGSVWGNGEGVGGLVGSSEGTITYCYAIASVSGDEEVGGLVGFGDGAISNCYCEAVVSGNRYIGGLVGWNHGTITNCYSTGGSISGNRYIGGLVGYNGYWGTVMDSFWDIETSGLSESGGGTGKTTAEMQMESTFTDAGWDFVGESTNGTEDIWWILEDQGYPRLWWEIPAKYAGGTGEPDDPYLIYTAEQLNAIGAETNDWDKHFKLMADIDLSEYTGTDFKIIGENYVRPFAGVFDGNGHVVKNFSFTDPSRRILGLFGLIGSTSEIKNIHLVDANVEGQNFVGLLVGYSTGTVSNCSATGIVRAGQYTGGLIGINMSGALTQHCRAVVNVSGTSTTGGLVGANSSSIIINCSAAGLVSGTSTTGGITGRQDNGTVLNSFSTCVVSGTGTMIGGLVGRNNYSLVSGCFAAGEVEGGEMVGGLVGFSDSEIANCYSHAKVIGSDYVGGLLGYNIYGYIGHSYSTGEVTGNTNVGASLGYDYGTCFYTSCFWNTDIQPSLPGISNATEPGLIGVTTKQMKRKKTYVNTGWDFVGEKENGKEDIWWIPKDDYPRLWWELSD